MEKKLISIIVPIYNVEEYLPRCVDSLIRQTYPNIEIILVDDGSPDHCGGICEEYAKRDNRIVVIHKENGGLSDARNAGLEIAKGDFVLFVDSDDWIEDETCEETIKLAIENNADLVPFGWNKVYDDGKTETISIKLKTEASAEECIKALMYKIEEYGLYNFACNKLCSKELYEGIRFAVGMVAEDQGVTYKLFHKARKIYICKKSLYNYYQRKDSISKARYKLSQTKDRITFWMERYDFIKEYYPQLEKYQLAQILGDIYICLTLYYNNGEEYSDFIKKINDFATQNCKRKKELTKYNKKVWLHHTCYPLFYIYVKLFIR